MKKLTLLLSLMLSLSAFAERKYVCDFKGPNAVLTIQEDNHITLEAQMRIYECQFGTTTFPGTEVDMKVINCQSENTHVMYYYTELNGDVILSRGLVWSKDVRCRRFK